MGIERNYHQFQTLLHFLMMIINTNVKNFYQIETIIKDRMKNTSIYKNIINLKKYIQIMNLTKKNMVNKIIMRAIDE